VHIVVWCATGFVTHTLLFWMPVVLYIKLLQLLHSSALLRLTSLPSVTHPLQNSAPHLWSQQEQVHPGTHSDAPPSRHRHGMRRPSYVPLGETRSSSGTSTSTAGASTTRSPCTWFRWDSPCPPRGVRWDGCSLPGFPASVGIIPGHRPSGSFGLGKGVRPRLMPLGGKPWSGPAPCGWKDMRCWTVLRSSPVVSGQSSTW
jgi:hypothetical protein